MMDKCTKIVMEFESDVLGPYQWSWDRDLAERVFDTLREQIRRNMQVPGFPPPVTTDLRSATKEGE